MCRLVGWSGERPRTLADLLGADALARFTDLSAVHGHGWGFGYLDPSTGRPRTIRSTRRAKDDPDFAEAAHTLAVPAAVVHLRWASPGYSAGLANTHPFTADGWALIHNGAIGPSSRIDDLLRPDSGRRPLGSTDSERLLLALLDELAPARPARAGGPGEAGRAGGPGGPGEAGEALAAAIEVVSTRAVRIGLAASSLNLMMLGRSGLHVLNWHDDSQAPPIQADDPSLPPYYDLRHHRDGETRVAASSGFVPETGEWELLPNASLLSLGPGEPVLRDVRPDLALCPIPSTATVSFSHRNTSHHGDRVGE